MDIVRPCIWVWRGAGHQKGGKANVPPCNGDTWVIHGQELQVEENGGLAACQHMCIMSGKCLCIDVCASLCQISPLVQRCVMKPDFRNQVVQFLTNPFLENF